ncbi:MAG TPA: hypothetical protein VGR09_08965, partial [Gemmatimonadales bacterium]|nr:hypothetical protein [Gemmatimonadales bacterium]
MSLHDLRALGLMLLIFVMVVLAAVLAWQHLDWVGFSLFALLFGWVVYQWRQYKELEDAVRMAEKRLCA